MSSDPLAGLAEAFRLQQAGQLDAAEAAYAKLLAGQPDDPIALINAGALALARGDLGAALARLERAVAQTPRNAIALNNLGFALSRAGRDDEALRALDRAIKEKPDYAQAHNNRGVALARLARRDEARAAFERARAIDPALVDAAVNLGDACAECGDHVHALEAYEGALAVDSTHIGASTGRGFALALSGALPLARSVLEDVVARHPDNAPAWQTLAAVSNWAWDHERAEAGFRRALALSPDNRDARFGIASTLLARGRYREGFEAFEHRPEGALDPQTRLAQWRTWNGADIDGTLLLHGEQGLGDVVQCARFLKRARERVRRIVLLLDGYWTPLAPLLDSHPAVDRVVTSLESLADEPIAARASILSLPYLVGVDVDNLPGPIPYLAASADRIGRWASRLSSLREPRIGLAWSVLARDRHAFVTSHKSIAAPALAPLVSLPDVGWVSLQPNAAGDPVSFGALASRIADFRSDIRDFADTAALIANLDLVIAPDTAVAHLAGALGKPVWLLDRFNCCWRWRLAPDTSPWYPTMSIFRQSRFGDWTEVLERVRRRLADHGTLAGA